MTQVGGMDGSNLIRVTPVLYAGDVDKAAGILKSASEVAPGLARPWIDLAKLHNQRGEHQAAFDVLLELEKAAPQALPLAAVAARLAQATAHPAHAFVADDYSLLDVQQLDWPRMLGHRQITDSYLLGLAVRHDCRFVTFDARVQPNVVAGAQARHLVSLGA